MSEPKKLSPEDIELYRTHGDDIAHLYTLAELLANSVDCKEEGNHRDCAFCVAYSAHYGCLAEEIRKLLERITLP